MRIYVTHGNTTFEFDGTEDEYRIHGTEILSQFMSQATQKPEADNSDAYLRNNITASSPKTMKAVATIFGSNTGPELAYAAAAYLSQIDGKESFTRQEMLNAIKSATGFYKPSYASNLTKYIDGLCKNGYLIEISNNTYAVKATATDKMLELLSK